MSISITLYKIGALPNDLDKEYYIKNATLTNTMTGNLTQASSIFHPIIRIAGDRAFTFNYAKIEWRSDDVRYYFIDDIVSVSSRLTDLYLREDVLYTFKDAILYWRVYVRRSSSPGCYDSLIEDTQRTYIGYTFTNQLGNDFLNDLTGTDIYICSSNRRPFETGNFAMPSDLVGGDGWLPNYIFPNTLGYNKGIYAVALDKWASYLVNSTIVSDSSTASFIIGAYHLPMSLSNFTTGWDTNGLAGTNGTDYTDGTLYLGVQTSDINQRKDIKLTYDDFVMSSPGVVSDGSKTQTYHGYAFNLNKRCFLAATFKINNPYIFSSYIRLMYNYYYLYLPGLGEVTLDNSLLFGTNRNTITIKVYYLFNFLFNEQTILVVNTTLENKIIFRGSCSLGQEIPLIQTNYQQIQDRKAQTAISASTSRIGTLIATGIGTTNPATAIPSAIGGGLSILGSYAQEYASLNALRINNTSNLTGSSKDARNANRVHLRAALREPVIAENDLSYYYIERKGLPCHKVLRLIDHKSKTINSPLDMSYFEVELPPTFEQDMSSAFTGTEDEYNEIRRLLNEGVRL